MQTDEEQVNMTRLQVFLEVRTPGVLSVYI